MKKFPKLKLLTLALLSTQSIAGGFSLYTEGSPSAIANYAAGIAAEGRDASVGYYNPAALVMLKKAQGLFGGVFVLPQTTLSGTSTYTTNLSAYGLGYKSYVQSFSDISGGREAIVPSVHIAIPGGDKVTYGLSIASPLGLATQWGEDAAVRYSGTFTHLKTIDVSPQMGGLLSDNFAAGWGLNLQWADVSYNAVVGSPVAAVLLLHQAANYYDTTTVNHGNSFGIGFHAGFLLKTSDNRTRFGFNYQYGVTQNFQGSSAFTGPLAKTSNNYFRSDNLYTNPIKFPDILTFSVYQDVNDKVALLGSIVYSMWSTFSFITLNNIASYNSLTAQNVFTGTTTTENYTNVLRASVGINYNLNDKWQFRAGGGYDQTPTSNVYRDVRLPDVDRLAAAFGLHWEANPNLAFDAGYSYLLPLYNTVINRTSVIGTNTNNITATGHSYAQLFGVSAIVRI